MLRSSDSVNTFDQLADVLAKIQITLASVDERIGQIERRIEEMNPTTDRPISAAEASTLLGCDQSTLCRFRKNWIEGVHYFRKGEQQGCLYNPILLLDWQRNRHNPATHQIAIDQWMAKQPENQRRKRK